MIVRQRQLGKSAVGAPHLGMLPGVCKHARHPQSVCDAVLSRRILQQILEVPAGRPTLHHLPQGSWMDTSDKHMRAVVVEDAKCQFDDLQSQAGELPAKWEALKYSLTVSFCANGNA